MAGRHVVAFEELRNTDVGSVGGKNASLGEMISQLAASGVRVPGGFARRPHPSFFPQRGGLGSSGAGHTPRGRTCMVMIMPSEISSGRNTSASIRPSVMACKGPAT